MLLGAKPYTVVIEEPNPGVCQLTIDYAIGQTQPIVDGLNAWAAHRTPLMTLYRNDEYPGADGIKRRTFSWESNLDGARAGLVFVSLHKTDGSSIRRDADEATLLYSVVKTQ
ncbi:hypothetical protein C5708_14015 [Caulobacter sp. CCUG 60055]|nr:hypothetical protein [Caulobacter sp. CCUG 60055]